MQKLKFQLELKDHSHLQGNNANAFQIPNQANKELKETIEEIHIKLKEAEILHKTDADILRKLVNELQ